MNDDLERDWMPSGPTVDEAKLLLAEHVEEAETAAADLPTDVRDGTVPEEDFA